jgi:hypothetical protein
VVSYIQEGTQIESENRLLRRIFVANRDEVTAGWRKFNNEELHNVHSSPNIIRMIKSKEDVIGRACNMHGEMRNV